MERAQSLINKLVEQAQCQAVAAELLKTTELLYAELRSYIPDNTVSIPDSVAVWLPAGYGVPKMNGKTAEAASAKAILPAEAPQPIKEKPVEEKPFEIKAVEQRPAEEIRPVVAAEKQTAAPQVPRVPMPPPQVKVVEPTREQVEKPEPTYKQPSQFFNMRISDDEENLMEEKEIEKKPEPAQTRSQQPASPPKTEPASSKPFPQYPDAATLMKNIFPLAPEPAPPARDLNQLKEDPAVALNEKLMEKKVELRDVLAAGPKITDLRKAISINDKYQMINSLFRSDEDMFERSIRTLNNFGSLPEARFWMQRELVLKLGWNEKDEMVQHFQALVSRRFS